MDVISFEKKEQHLCRYISWFLTHSHSSAITDSGVATGGGGVGGYNLPH